MHQLVQIAHELDRLRDGLREAGTGVQADAVVGDARSLEFGCPFGKRIADFPHYVVVLRKALHIRRLALHMHDHQAGIAVCGNLDHIRIAEPGDVVDDSGARIHASLRHLRMTRVDADAHTVFY